MSAAGELYLHLVDVVGQRLDVARAAQKSGDGVPISVWEDGFLRVRARLEAEVERYCERDLKVLMRHGWTDRDDYRYGITCTGCPNSASSWPCPEIKDLAQCYEVSVE